MSDAGISPEAQSTPLSSAGDASRLGSGSGLVLLGLGTGRGVKLLTRVLIGRLLGAASLGIYDLAWTMVLILSNIARGGLQVAVVRFGAPLWSRGRVAALRSLVLRGLVVPLILGGAMAAALWLTAPWLAEEFFHKRQLTGAIRIVALLVPVASALALLAGATQASQRMSYTVLTRDLAEPVLQFIIFLLLWALGFKLASALWGALIGGVLACLLAGVVVWNLTRSAADTPTPRAGGSEPSLADLVLFSLPVAVAGMLSAYLLWADRLLVGYFRPAVEVGIYSAAAQFGILFALLLHGFNTMFTPMFSDLLDRGEEERMRELYRVSTKWGLYLLLPLMVVLAVLPRVALGGLFGPEFTSGATALRILLIGQLANILSGHVGMVLILCGHQRLVMWISGVALTINVVLGVVWIPRFGLEGAAAASSVALVFLFLSGLLYVRRSLDLFPLDRRFWKLVPPVVAMLTIAIGGRLLAVPTNLFGFIGVLTLVYLVGAAVRLLLPHDDEDTEMLTALRGRSRSLR